MTGRYLLLLFFVLGTATCTAQSDESHNFEVKYNGALKNIMHQGDLSVQADLSDFEHVKNLYALGAVEGLKGEVLVLNSNPYISSVDKETISINHSFDHKATLLVYSIVEEWTTFEISEDISTYEDLQQYIEEAANDYGIDTAQPFPFLIEGNAKSFDWHVINWIDGDNVHTPEKHKNSGAKGTLSNQEVEILGFYSTGHHAIFTHHSTNMHLHVLTKDGKIAGHLDGIVPGKDMVLKLPVAK